MITVIVIFCQSGLFDPQKVHDFAEYLHASGDYAAALSEYNRYKFLGDTLESDIELKIIDCLIRLGRFNDALNNARRHEHRNYWQGIIQYHAASYDSARYYLKQSETELEYRAKRFIGLSHAAQFDFKTMIEYVDFDQPLPSLKRPWLGGFLSAVPGAGHIYANRFGDGIFSFLTIAMLGAVSYYYYQTDEDLKFGIAVSATVLFYAGNIYGGINAVRNYNFYRNSQYLDAVLREYNEFDY